MQEYASEMVNGAFADSCSRFGAMGGLPLR